MTTYNSSAVSDAAIAHKKGISLQTQRSLRDNLLAIAEGSSGAPRVAVKALRSGSGTARTGLSGYQGGVFHIQYSLTSGVLGSGSVVLEFSADGSTFPASLAIAAIGAESSEAETIGVHVDFATGGYVGHMGQGTIGSMPASPTHYRVTATADDASSAKTLCILNGGDAAS
jgi:hypothetical protein